MTTPERLRRRQRLESFGIALLAVLLVAATLYFKGVSDAQQACLRNYISFSSHTSAVRARLLDEESAATRHVIVSGLTAGSHADIERAKQQYDDAMQQIDRARAANPVQPIPKGVCD